MSLKKGQIWIFLVNLFAIIFFTFKALGSKNYEFIMYLGVIILFFILIYSTNKKVNFSNKILWGLTIWALLHMAGGLFIVNGSVLYRFVLIKIFEHPEFIIFKYDQLVHFFGFFIATLACYDLIRPNLKEKINLRLNFLIFLFGAGLGAMNEIVEFMAVLIFPATGVGGYYNTLWDLVFNSFGALLAIGWVNIQERKHWQK